MKNCEFKGCKKVPYYNFKTKDEKPIYCAIHKLPGMVNLIHGICLFKGCIHKKLYKYKNPGEKAKYCSIHKLPGIIKPTKKYYKCIIDGCLKHAYYNIIKKPVEMPDPKRKKRELNPEYCSIHRTKEMFNLFYNKRCQYKDCNIIPCYNYPLETTQLYCNAHKLDGMINIHKHKYDKNIMNKKSKINYPDYLSIKASANKRIKLDAIDAIDDIDTFNYDVTKDLDFIDNKTEYFVIYIIDFLYYKYIYYKCNGTKKTL